MNTYIPPTGVIQMLVGVHLNPNQENTLYFEGPSIRDSYFDRFVYRTYDAQTYSRPTKKSVKIQDNAGTLYRCQYMRFRNGNAFGGVWLYAFVDAVEYINNNTCEVFYTIDDMITWFPWCSLRECFVEREIPSADTPYTNFVDENLNIGADYVVQMHNTIDLNQKVVVVASTRWINDSEGHSAQIESAINTTIPNALKYEFFIETAPTTQGGQIAYKNWKGQSFQDRLEDYMGDDDNPDNVTYIAMMPKICYDQSFQDGHVTPEVYNLPFPQNNLFDYVPKNKKLLNYPYRCIRVSNNSGQSNIYKYELFNLIQESDTIDFGIVSSFLGNGSALMYPYTYARVEHAYEQGLTLANFPTIPWANDAYQAYLAQNKASINTSVLSSVVTGLGGMASIGLGIASLAGTMGASTPASISMITGGALTVAHSGTSIASTLAKSEDAKAIPDTVRGLTQTDYINAASGHLQYDIYCISIRPEYAKVIDDFFSAFGYALHEIKIPDIKSRPKWNYVKTQGCVVVGDVPADALANISAIFDRGIRFWKDMSYIGDYTLNNSPGA